MKIIASYVAIAALCVTTQAMAQGTPAQRAACTPDVFKLCSSEIPNVDNIRTCLRTKKASLSGECRAVFDLLDKPVQAASRSVAPRTGWCDFTVPGSDDSTWSQWCGKEAWKN